MSNLKSDLSKERKLDYLQILDLFRDINGTWTWTGSESLKIACLDVLDDLA